MPIGWPCISPPGQQGSLRPWLATKSLVRNTISLVLTHQKGFSVGKREKATSPPKHISTPPPAPLVGQCFVEDPEQPFSLTFPMVVHTNLPTMGEGPGSRSLKHLLLLGSSQGVKKPSSDSRVHHPTGMRPEKLEPLAEEEKK